MSFGLHYQHTVLVGDSVVVVVYIKLVFVFESIMSNILSSYLEM